MAMTETSQPVLSADDLVLIADDEAFSRLILCEILDHLGRPRTIIACDGAEALAALADKRAAGARVVILDFNMPGANGIELLQEIRSGRLAVPHDVIVMMITSLEVLGLVAAAVALDVDVFLTKPVSAADLRRYLLDLLGRERACLSPRYYAEVDLQWLTSAGRINPSLGAGEEVAVDGLVEGMVIARDLLDSHGDLLLSAGSRVTPRLLRLLRLLRGLVAAGLPLVSLRVIRPG